MRPRRRQARSGRPGGARAGRPHGRRAGGTRRSRARMRSRPTAGSSWRCRGRCGSRAGRPRPSRRRGRRGRARRRARAARPRRAWPSLSVPSSNVFESVVAAVMRVLRWRQLADRVRSAIVRSASYIFVRPVSNNERPDITVRPRDAEAPDLGVGRRARRAPGAVGSCAPRDRAPARRVRGRLERPDVRPDRHPGDQVDREPSPEDAARRGRRRRSGRRGSSKYIRLRRDELDERFPGLLESVLNAAPTA